MWGRSTAPINFFKIIVTKNTFEFPTCFSEAKNKLRMKFRTVDIAAIDDSIQHAKIEYWKNGIAASITDENEAMGWFLNVAYRYLYKEVDRINRFCSIFSASNISTGVDPERQFIYREMLNTFSEKSSKNRSILVQHAYGYSLKELAKSSRISLDAMKQRHAREKRLVLQNPKILFY